MTAPAMASTAVAATAMAAPVVPPKPRGRPPKEKAPVDPDAPRPRRGRPPKAKSGATATEPVDPSQSPTDRKRKESSYDDGATTGSQSIDRPVKRSKIQDGSILSQEPEVPQTP
jgi:hypothetical protein